jgi:outer membrane protein OmpA-like peptidoglycan-associated protein
MTRYRGLFCVLGLLGASSAWGQAQRGDGLKGEYYDGREFEKLVVSRRDATLDFDWHGTRPVAGLTPDDFSVRWTGWLVPPTTGRYVLHISVDDGIRLWLNDRQLLDDWHGHSLNYYQVEVDLKAGEPYALRVDYCQHAQATQARLAWLPPASAPTSKRRIRQGAAEHLAEAVVIPTRYLFSHFPTVVRPKPDTLIARQPLAQPEPPPAAAPRTAGPSKAALLEPTPLAGQRPRPVSYLRPAPKVAAPPAGQPPARPAAADSGRVTALATRLASGQALTLRALYFEQGKADLLPMVQANLDTLARALTRRPTLRLEVQGHTDNQGDPAVNQLLSRRRAEAVCQYLAGRGVAASRLRAVGYGGSRPVADNRQPDLRPRNRRVVLLPLVR